VSTFAWRYEKPNLWALLSKPFEIVQHWARTQDIKLEKMNAVVKGKRQLGAEITRVNLPKIKEGDVLIEVEAASICGTDVHIWDWNEWAQNRMKRIPIVFGHEVAGRVVEIGKNVTDVHVGDKVSAETHIVDNTCYQCKTDRKHVCKNMEILGVDRDGVFAE